MAPVSNPRVLFKAIPSHYPVPGQHTVYDASRTIDLDNVLLDGGFLTKTLVLSPEPYMRERMRDRSVASYSTTFKLGAPIIGLGVVVVLRSEDENIAPGTYMHGMTPWEAYTVQPYTEGRWDFNPKEWPPYTFNMDSLALQPVPDPRGAFPLSTYVGALGTPGMTAFCGMELAKVKQGETVFVSSGAGAVGSMVCQLAKLAGLKVIACASSDAKLDYMKSELGVDVAFNYKTTSVADALAKSGPIDVYWDNVGGSTLEAAIDACTLKARIVMCGYASEYNGAEPYGVKNLASIFKKRISMLGLLVPDHSDAILGRFFSEMPPLVAQGKIKSREMVVKGLENAEAAFVGTLKGENIGKTVVIVAEA